MTEFRWFIKKRGYTLKSLAEKAGVNVWTLRRLRPGAFQWKNCNLGFALAVANVLEIPVQKLLDFDNQEIGVRKVSKEMNCENCKWKYVECGEGYCKNIGYYCKYFMRSDGGKDDG